MNELSAKGYSHRIADLYEAVKPLAPNLMPSLLTAPAQWGDDFWYDETPELFMRRLYKNGQAANRYQLVGYVLQGEDLFKLDQMVFAVRRLCQCLNAHFLGKKWPNVPDQSVRDRMLMDTDSWKLRSKLEEFIEGKHGAKLQHVLLNWNFLFAPAGYTHTPIDLHFASRNPVPVRRIIEPIDAGPKAAAEADLIWQWVQEKIELPKGFVPSMNSARADRKAKAKK
jgi:hypothetical protein